ANDRLYLTSGHNGFLLRVRPDGKGDITKSNVEWSFNKGVPTRPSLLLVDDLIFMCSDKGIAGCVEARTGTRVKDFRLGGEYSASPLYADGRIYFFNQEGESFVVEPTREMKVMATNKLDAGCMATPAISGKAMFLRSKTHLYRIEQK